MANETLKTPEQYAKHFGKTKQRVYQIIKADKKKCTLVAGVPFIDLAKFPTWEGFTN